MNWPAYVAAVFTVLIGTAGLVAPRRTARMIGLSLDGALGEKLALSQFRATLGGFFVFAGAAVLVLQERPAALVLGLAWLGTAAGRAVSVVVDRSVAPRNIGEGVGEVVLGLLLVLGSTAG